MCVCHYTYTHILVAFYLYFFLYSPPHFHTLPLRLYLFGTDRLILTNTIHSLWIWSALLVVVITVWLILCALSFLLSTLLLFDARARLSCTNSLLLFSLWVFVCALTFIESLYPSLATEVKFL